MDDEGDEFEYDFVAAGRLGHRTEAGGGVAVRAQRTSDSLRREYIPVQCTARKAEHM
jgi:hypothetical protein